MVRHGMRPRVIPFFMDRMKWHHLGTAGVRSHDPHRRCPRLHATTVPISAIQDDHFATVNQGSRIRFFHFSRCVNPIARLQR